MKRSLTILLGLLAVGTARAIPTDEAAFLWEEANNRMARARGAADFQEAARTYSELTENGIRNGHLFYNLGTAQALGQQYDEAIASLLRAERFMGSSPEIRGNLLLALKGQSEKGKAGINLPWYRPLLFWHYGLATRTRVTVALSAFACFWVLMSLRVLGMRAGIAQFAGIAVAIAIVFGSSAVTSIHQDSQAEQAAALRAQLIEESR